MAKVVKSRSSGAFVKSFFNPNRDGFVFHPNKAETHTLPDSSRIDELLKLNSRELHSRFKIDSTSVAGVAGPELTALSDKPDAQRAFLRILRDGVSPEPPKMSFRGMVDSAFLLPDAVFSTLKPLMLIVLGKYPQELSKPGLESLMRQPDALKPFLRFKKLVKFRARHSFSDMMENAIQLPENVFDENAPEVIKRLGNYANEIPYRTRRILTEEPGQLRPYLLLRHKLGLSGKLPALPDLAGTILKGIDGPFFTENKSLFITLLSGCAKRELGDNTLSFLEKYRPEQLRSYLEIKAGGRKR